MKKENKDILKQKLIFTLEDPVEIIGQALKGNTQAIGKVENSIENLFKLQEYYLKFEEKLLNLVFGKGSRESLLTIVKKAGDVTQSVKQRISKIVIKNRIHKAIIPFEQETLSRFEFQVSRKIEATSAQFASRKFDCSSVIFRNTRSYTS